uniref:Uncharacterized protein n=1 Tax=Fagus sylvatica TaxID=28930 RepID=A0A2N9HZH1_FAGSY
MSEPIVKQWWSRGLGERVGLVLRGLGERNPQIGSAGWRVLIAGLGNGGRESCGVVAHGGEWVLVVFLITSSSLKPIALSQFDVGQYASTLGLDLSHSGLVRSWSSLGSSLPSS